MSDSVFQKTNRKRKHLNLFPCWHKFKQLIFGIKAFNNVSSFICKKHKQFFSWVLFMFKFWLCLFRTSPTKLPKCCSESVLFPEETQHCALIHHYLRSLQTLTCEVKQLIIERQMCSGRYMQDALTSVVFSPLLFPKLAYLVDWLLPGFCKSSNTPSFDGDKEKRCCKLGCRIHTYVACLAGELVVLALTFSVVTGDCPQKRASFYDKCRKQLF